MEKYQVVRIADEIVVDLMESACGIKYDAAVGRTEVVTLEGVPVPVASRELLIEMKQTVRPSDAADVQFLKLRIAADENDSGGGQHGG